MTDYRNVVVQHGVNDKTTQPVQNPEDDPALKDFSWHTKVQQQKVNKGAKSAKHEPVHSHWLNP